MARKKEFDEGAVLDKAVDLFWQKGYHATSAQDLVDGLGLSRSSIYDTYTDKRTLFKRSLQQYQDKNTQAMLNMLATADDAEKAIKQIFDDIIRESAADTLARGCFMVNTAVELSSRDAEIGQMVTLNNQSVESALARMIEKGQHDGVFSTRKSPQAFARFVFGNITAMRVAARSGEPLQALRDIADITLSALK